MVGLARYPVKSMGGESCTEVDCGDRGLEGDRLWAVRDPEGKLGSGKSTTRFRRIDGLLGYTARYDETGVPVVTTPGGETLRAGDAGTGPRLSHLLGASVTLAREEDVPHMDAGAVSLTTTGSLRALGELLGDDGPVDVRRFRKNVLIELAEPWAEESWMGKQITIGAARLRISKRIERCVMVDLPQRDLPADGRVLKTLGDLRELCFGVYADVVLPGRVAIGDVLEVAT